MARTVNGGKGCDLTAPPLFRLSIAIAPAMTDVSPAATCTAINAKKSGASEERGKPAILVGFPISEFTIDRPSGFSIVAQVHRHAVPLP